MVGFNMPNGNHVEVPDPPGHKILLTEAGSKVHGMAIGSDDIDLMGITIEPRDVVFGLREFETYTWRTAREGERSTQNDIDLTYYSLKKYLRLATAGNPSTLLPLYVPTQFIHVNTVSGMELRELAPAIASQKAVPRFLGYMEGQRKRALDGRSLGRGMGSGLNDPDADKKRWGKWASHMVRLGYELNDLLVYGRIKLPLSPAQAEVCISVKKGELTVSQAIKLSESLEESAKALQKTTDLRPEPDMDAVQEWMYGIYKSAY